LTRARDVANVLSTASELATDIETSAAISSHNSSTTSVHGIANTALLATQTYVQDNKGINKGNTASRPASPANGDLYYNTETSLLEVYDGGWWVQNTLPGIPTSPVATNSGSGRAFNNGRASVAFTPATSGGKATTFTVTSTPGSYTASGSSSPIVVTGLQSSTQYTYAVTATGPLGTSSASSASSAVTATTVPQAPTIGTATGGDAQASVTFTANSTGGSAITEYTITSSPGNITASGATSPVVVTGLTNGTSYTFTAVATNANGSSTASSASNSISPSSGVTLEYLVIAGGGGGGRGANEGYGGGGGGAGGLRSSSSIFSSGQTYTIAVGAGGVKGIGNYSGSQYPSSGVNSSITGTAISYSSSGGGRGSTVFDTGGNGGSGGGAGGHYSGTGGIGGSGNAGGYTPVEGYAGGNGQSGQPARAGGGGGAGGVGANAGGSSGNGGVGSNAYSTWASATSTGSGGYYAGGGAAGGGGSDGTGGLGGGGNGGVNQHGATNTGSGGGGTGNGSEGGNGGSGIVILRKEGTFTASSTTGSPTRVVSGGYTYYTFLNNGSITI